MSAQRNTYGAYVLSLSLDQIFVPNCMKYTYTERAARFRCAVPRFTQNTKRSSYTSNKSRSVTFSLLHLSSHLTEITVCFSCLDGHLFPRPQLMPHRNQGLFSSYLTENTFRHYYKNQPQVYNQMCRLRTVSNSVSFFLSVVNQNWKVSTDFL